MLFYSICLLVQSVWDFDKQKKQALWLKLSYGISSLVQFVLKG